MKKKLISLGLVTALTLGLITGCGGGSTGGGSSAGGSGSGSAAGASGAAAAPAAGAAAANTASSGGEVSLLVKVPSLTMSTPADPDINIAEQFLIKAAEDFSAQYDGAKVSIEVREFNQEDETASIPGCFETEDAADVVYAGYFNIATYIHSGYVTPIDDIITDEMKADINDSWWESSKLNGKTYMMPFLGLENVLAFNKQMFRDAGLDKYVLDEDVVQNWSIDEWNDILAALRASLPDTSYPMMMYAGDNQADTHIMTLLRMFGCKFFDENGHLIIESEEGMKALQWIRDGFEAGYFPSNAEDLVSNDVFNAFLAGQIGIIFNNAALDVSMTEKQEIGYVNFPSVNGKGLNTTFVTGFQVYDNGDPAKVQAAKDFVKYIYESDYIYYSAGGIPASDKVSAKYADELAFLQKYIDVSDCGVNFTGNQPNWRGVRANFYPHIQDLLFGEKDIETVAKELDADCSAAIDEGYADSKLHE
ncbi:MAG: extracellular solute-binding protein [Eubacteriales bacterium]|nr:extracellular solute-binding protein [Eubacteriales bacterium]